MLKKTNRGYTLIEIMMVVIIVGILAAVAIPSYVDNVKRGRRSDAKAKLMQDVQSMEAFLTVNNAYDKDTTGVAVALPITTSPIGAVGNNIDYDISFAVATTQTTYKIQAVPHAGGKMDGDACGTFTIDNFGARTVSGSLSMDQCWSK